MFKSSYDLLNSYCNRLKEKGLDAVEPAFQTEASQRLQQMGFIIDRIRKLSQRTQHSDLMAQARHEHLMQRVAPHLRDLQAHDGMLERLQQTMPMLVNELEIKVLTEAFYYCASRARDVVQMLPGLKKFEAKGVRDVRNWLLEHPEKDASRVIEDGFSFSLENGPVIKGVRRADKVDVFPDRGLYVNANEFATQLEQRLQRLIAEPKQSVGKD
jgi:hypothetical protein